MEHFKNGNAGPPTHKGTLVPANEAAIVTCGDVSDIEFLMPEFEDTEEVPDLIMCLMACYLRLQNETGFIEEQMDWLTEQKQMIDARKN